MSLIHKETQDRDRRTGPAWRFINRDGSTNVDNSSFRRGWFSDLYHILLSVSWIRLLGGVAAVYLTINAVFGTGYFLAGESAIRGMQPASPADRWLQCFFFSVQTLATIGYGNLSPATIPADVLVTIEALAGLLSLALATGIIFARFSRPTARVRFSDQALLTRISGRTCLVFRMANERLNQIVEAQVRVVMSMVEKTSEGVTFRELYDLKLERERSPLFAMSWTVIHWIDSTSPLYGATRKSLAESDVELIVTLTGTDETFSQSVHARFSYSADNIVWNAYFEDMISQTPEGKLHVAIERISAIRPSPGSKLGERIE